MVLEKAWAKLHGSYHRIEGGEAYHTLRDLTGAPSFDYAIEDEIGKNLWDRILEYHQEDYIMTAGIDEGAEEQDEKLGLVAGHAYGLICVK